MGAAETETHRTSPQGAGHVSTPDPSAEVPPGFARNIHLGPCKRSAPPCLPGHLERSVLKREDYS